MVTSERLSVDHYSKTSEGFLIYLIHIVAYRWFLKDCKGKGNVPPPVEIGSAGIACWSRLRNVGLLFKFGVDDVGSLMGREGRPQDR